MLTMEAVGVHVEPGAAGQGGLLLGEGPQGVDMQALGQALASCEPGQVEYLRGVEFDARLREWTNKYALVGGLCEGLSAAFSVVDRREVATNIVAASHLLSQAASPASDNKLALFPGLRSPNVLRVIAALGDLVKADPDDSRPFTALVKFFNFIIRINTACQPEECPA